MCALSQPSSTRIRGGALPAHNTPVCGYGRFAPSDLTLPSVTAGALGESAPAAPAHQVGKVRARRERYSQAAQGYPTIANRQIAHEKQQSAYAPRTDLNQDVSDGSGRWRATSTVTSKWRDLPA